MANMWLKIYSGFYSKRLFLMTWSIVPNGLSPRLLKLSIWVTYRNWRLELSKENCCSLTILKKRSTNSNPSRMSRSIKYASFLAQWKIWKKFFSTYWQRRTFTAFQSKGTLVLVTNQMTVQQPWLTRTRSQSQILAEEFKARMSWTSLSKWQKTTQSLRGRSRTKTS